MVLGLVVPAETTSPIRRVQFHRLSDYQTAVGGLIEAVDIPRLELSVYVNDEGVIYGLPTNERITALWWAFVPETRYRASLVGDAVIIGQPDHDGDSTDVPDAILARLLAWLS